MTKLLHHYGGHIRDSYDPRDKRYKVKRGALAAIPKKVDLRGDFPDVKDQGQVGSCTAFAATGLLAYVQKKKGLALFGYSELDLYYSTRSLEGTTGEDAGAQVRDVIKASVKFGVCSEELWPYDPTQVTVQPPDQCRIEALNHQTLGYFRVQQDIQQMKACLAAGNPVDFGFTVYESFDTKEVASTGIVPMPKRGERILGGHSVVLVGYDTYKRRKGFYVRNSWSKNWGMDGYFFMPEAYVVNSQLSSDLWTVTDLEG
jgi:C1A family cysteine protease